MLDKKVVRTNYWATQKRTSTISEFAASSILFVPGSRADRFEKAKTAGAGLTVIDLEDSVPADDKESARAAAFSQVDGSPAGWAIRLNAINTAAGIADLHALAQSDVRPDFLFMTMVEDVAEIRIVADVLANSCVPLVPTIETPKGLRNAREIAQMSQVAAVMLGGADFAAEIGVTLSWEPLMLARQQLVLACAEARKAAIDVPFIHLDDEAGLADECQRARSVGFTCKAAIHPRQLDAIHQAFAPSEAEITEANEALAAFEKAGGKAIRFNGRMLEAPLVKQYRAVIARSKGQNNA